LISKDHSLHASTRGVISQVQDQSRIDRFWGPMVAAWYPDGKDDPKLVFLRMDLEEASVWLSTSNPIKMIWEVAKANRERRLPDIGRHEEIGIN
jgi:general stress protein 26